MSQTDGGPDESGSSPSRDDQTPDDQAGDDQAPEIAVTAGTQPEQPSESIPVDAGKSGSIEVELSGTALPVTSDGTPVAVAAVDSTASSASRSQKLVARARSATLDVIETGVTRLGTGVERLGEEVIKLGEKSRNVPIVGSSVAKLGEGISTVGGSLHELPRVTHTRRGRLLIRSLLVGFALVFSWIAAIVAVQIRTNPTPDFRPIAERILVQLTSGDAAIEQLYDQASPRFQEMVRKEQFLDDMRDLHATIGRFREITAVRDTRISSGPTGRVGWVSLTAAFDKATCRATVSLHRDEAKWKLLYVNVELPPSLTISQAQREERVAACKDPMSTSCDLFVAANTILEQLRDGNAANVWDQASPVFQQQEDRARFTKLQVERAAVLGNYVRIIAVTTAKVIGGTQATYDVLTEYASSKGVRATFGFTRAGRPDPWKLRSLKIVLPLPRAAEVPTAPAATPVDSSPRR